MPLPRSASDRPDRATFGLASPSGVAPMRLTSSDWLSQPIEQMAVPVGWVLHIQIWRVEVGAIPSLERVSAVDVEDQPIDERVVIELHILSLERRFPRTPEDTIGKNIATERMRRKSTTSRFPDWLDQEGVSWLTRSRSPTR